MIAQWIREKLTTPSNPARWFVDWVRGPITASGIDVDEQTALAYSAVWAATCFLTGSIASLPLILYRALADDDRARATDHPYYALLRDHPNDEQDSFVFWEEMALYLINWGNAYAEKEYLINGRVIGLWPIKAGRVRPYRDGPGGPVRYEITSDYGAKRYLGRADLLHISGRLSHDGITGMGVIHQARESIGNGIATERFGGSFFGQGAVPGGVLKHPGKYSQKAEENLRAGWEKMHRGPDQGSRVAVLWENMAYEKIGIPPEDAQFLETRQFNVAEIARWYALPPHILADLTHGTFSNIEHLDLEVVKYCLRTWFVRIERSLKAQLLGPENRDLYWEFLIDALLRGDLASRTAAHVQEFLNGALTINEWRRMENRNRVKGDAGDKHFVPLNLVPIDTAVNPPPEPTPPTGIAASAKGPGDLTSVRVVEKRMRQLQATALRRAARHPDTFLQHMEPFLRVTKKPSPRRSPPWARPWESRPTGRPRSPHSNTWTSASRFLTAAECQPGELAARIETLLHERTNDQ